MMVRGTNQLTIDFTTLILDFLDGFETAFEKKEYNHFGFYGSCGLGVCKKKTEEEVKAPAPSITISQEELNRMIKYESGVGGISQNNLSTALSKSLQKCHYPLKSRTILKHIFVMV